LFEKEKKGRKMTNARASKSGHETTPEILSDREEMYRMLMIASPDAVTVTDLRGTIIELSQRTLRLHGFGHEDELLGQNAFALIAPEDRKRARMNIERTREEGILEKMEYTMVRKDGTRFIGELNAALIKDGHGKPKGFIATTRDITKRRKTEEALEESESKYRTLVEKAKDGIYIYQDERFVYVNESFCETLGYSEEEIRDCTDFLTLVADEHKGLIRSRERKLKEGKMVPPHYGFLGKKKNGEKVYFDANISLITYNGRPARLGILRDITERKDHEKRLLHVIENANHLINTPLTVAFGYIDMVKLGRKEMAPELLSKVHEKLSEIRVRVNEEMVDNIHKLTVPTSNGWTPV